MKAAQGIVFSGEAYRNFIYSAKSEATKKSYCKALRLFMKFRGVTTCKQLLEGQSRLIQSNIIEWLIHLKENKNLSSASITLYVAALRHFYSMNDISELNWKKIHSFTGESIKTIKDRPYARDEIRKILDAASDRRLKIAILLMCTAGLRVGAITSLKVGSLVKIPKYHLYQITVYENTRVEYVTFCTPECASIIDSYFDYRRRNGDRLQADAPLIREEFNIDDSLRAANPRAISTHTLRARLYKLLISCGLRNRQLEQEISASGGWEGNPRHRRLEVMQSHGFRKFFSTTCTLQGLSPIYIEVLMGHKALGVTGVYFKPTPMDLLEGNDKMLGYVNIMKSLSTSDESRLLLEIERLSLKDNENSQIIKNALEEKDEQIRTLNRHDIYNSDAIAGLSDKIQELGNQIRLLQNRAPARGIDQSQVTNS